MREVEGLVHHGAVLPPGDVWARLAALHHAAEADGGGGGARGVGAHGGVVRQRGDAVPVPVVTGAQLEDLGLGGRDWKKRKKEIYFSPVPTNNALLINFLPSSDAEILFNNHRPSIRVGAKTCKNVYVTCTCSD